MSGFNFEASGDLSDWPKNVPGKPTQVAVFGMYQRDSGKEFELLWTAKFPDLDPAMYWAAKKEVQAVRKGKWQVASRVLWQHDITPEQAVDACRRSMQAQLDRMMKQAEAGEQPDIGDGPMKPVDPSKVQGHYFEIEYPEFDDSPGWFVPRDPNEGKPNT